ncbi:MAG: rane protein involved in aromatic hydrocarbon degradation [Betaproteobacteria bacterium]|nr:rane protein involved in aromatic hydrocarbon degradation [Betaproteobacteria bacterium]
MKQQAFAVRKLLSCVIPAVLAFAVSGPVSATGFFINQQSVKGLGRVDAGNTAAADDLGTIFFNPAGLNEVFAREPGKGFMWSIGTNLVIPRSEQTNVGSAAASPGTLGAFVPYAGGDARNPVAATPIPNLYFAKKISDQAAVGLAFNAPFGLKTESNPAWFGRYDAIEASLRTYNLSAVGAYKFETGLSIGGGIDVQYARTTLTSAIPDPLNPGGPTAATDARVSTVGHDWTPGFNIGLLYPVDVKTRIGAHYRSGMKHNISGSSAFTGFTGPLAGFNGVVGAGAVLHLPAIATVGVRHQLTERLALLGELEWFNWSKFREIRVMFQDGRADGVRQTNYRDTYAVAVGAEYRVPGSALTTRGGLQFDRTPTVDAFRDTTVPDANRLWLGFGGSYRWSDRTTVDFAFNHVFFRDTNVALTRSFFEGTPLATTTRINGAVTNVVNTVGIDLRFAY